MVMTNIRVLILLGDILVLNINFLIGNLVTRFSIYQYTLFCTSLYHFTVRYTERNANNRT